MGNQTKNLISANGIVKKNGPKLVIDDITFGISDNQRIALVGRNGCGKTTLLRLILGQIDIDSGELTKNRELTVAYAGQSTAFEPADSISTHIFKGTSARLSLIKNYESVRLKLEAGDASYQAEFERLEAEMTHQDAWKLESEVRSILHHLGIVDLEQTMGTLSGGMQRKVDLAQALIEHPDLLVLDEPTNHLDITSILWLEKYLTKYSGALILVTHDRYFLERVTNNIWELENAKLRRFKGNFSEYLIAKAELDEAELKSRHKENQLLKKELEWMRRQPKARGTKAKARTGKIEKLGKRPALPKTMADFGTETSRQGKRILDAKNLTKSIAGKELFTKFTYYFRQGEKVGILGPNGCGKSTLLRVLNGKEEADSGHVNVGINTNIGFFEQTGIDAKASDTVLGYIRSKAEYINYNSKRLSAAQFLEFFLFDRKTHGQRIENLSGGEKRKLQLLGLLIQNPNFLILDEPTNDLDIATLSALEDFLQGYTGNLLVVSHDRYFLDKAVNTLLIWDKQILSFPGSATDYLEYLKKAGKDKNDIYATTANDSETDEADEVAVTKSSKPKKKKTKLSYKEEREYKQLEIDVPALEIKLKDLETKLASNPEDSKLLNDWGEEYVAVETELMEKMERMVSLLDSIEE